MTDAQTWTAMALLSSLLVAVMTLLTRTVRAEMAAGFERLGREMDARFTGLLGDMNGRFGQMDGRFAEIDGRFAQIDGRFAEMNSRFDVLSNKVDNLDRDVQFLMHREFGDS